MVMDILLMEEVARWPMRLNREQGVVEMLILMMMKNGQRSIKVKLIRVCERERQILYVFKQHSHRKCFQLLFIFQYYFSTNISILFNYLFKCLCFIAMNSYIMPVLSIF